MSHAAGMSQAVGSPCAPPCVNILHSCGTIASLLLTVCCAVLCDASQSLASLRKRLPRCMVLRVRLAAAGGR